MSPVDKNCQVVVLPDLTRSSVSTRSHRIKAAERANPRKNGHHLGCTDERQHFYVVLGKPGLRSPVCVYCGNPAPRRLTSLEWDEYERYWREERHVFTREEFADIPKVDATRNAWASGFLDGEGHFAGYMTSGDNRRTVVSLSASQINPEPLKKLRQMFGGKVIALHRPTKRNRRVHKWEIQSAHRLRVILPILLPYLTVKKDECNVLIELLSLISSGKGRHASKQYCETVVRREELVIKLRDLKHRSWDHVYDEREEYVSSK